MRKKSLLNRIESWVQEGLISSTQAVTLKQRVAEEGLASRLGDQVKLGEILVYLGSLIVFIGLAFLIILNWDSMGRAARIVSTSLPTICMLLLGWLLRGSSNSRLNRGAQALWLGGALVSGFCFGVLIYEFGIIDCSKLHDVGPSHLLIVLSSLLATGVAGLALVFLATVTQSIALHFCGTITALMYIGWLDRQMSAIDTFGKNLVFLAIGICVGGLWLLLASHWHRKDQEGLFRVSLISGVLTILGFALVLSMWDYPAIWQMATLESVGFLFAVLFVVAGVGKQLIIPVYCGTGAVLVLTIYVSLEHFAEKIGMPVVLLIIGASLISLGLAAGKLTKLIRSSG